MGDTSIQYVDRSVNPVRARNRVTRRIGHWCEKVSPGCKNCYSSAWQPFRGQGSEFEIPNRDKVEVYFEPRAMDEVLSRKKPTRWFWCDMTDFWGEWVKDEWIDQMFAVMALTPQHTHLWPTKRPERMRAYLTEPACPHRIRDAIWRWHDAQEPTKYRLSNRLPEHPLAVAHELNDRLFSPRWPLPNVHAGVSVENKEALSRIDILADVPTAVRWVSFEPLLEDLGSIHDKLDAARIAWAVWGGESGSDARPCDLAWIRTGLSQCWAAKVPAFFKQAGSRVIDSDRLVGVYAPHDRRSIKAADSLGSLSPTFNLILLRDRKGGDPSEWPEDLRVREFPR